MTSREGATTRGAATQVAGDRRLRGRADLLIEGLRVGELEPHHVQLAATRRPRGHLSPRRVIGGRPPVAGRVLTGDAPANAPPPIFLGGAVET